MMDAYSSTLAIFEKPAIEAGISKVEWISFSPIGQLNNGSPLEFDIPGNFNSYISLANTKLRVSVKITKKDGSPIKFEPNAPNSHTVALSNLSLHSLFRQVDISLNQKTITTSVASYYPFKNYIDNVLNATNDEANTSLQAQLYFKDTPGALEAVHPSQGNVGFYQRMIYTLDGKAVTLEGTLGMDVCQQERLILDGVRIRIKMYQSDDEFRLMCKGKEEYKVSIVDAKLMVCHVKVNPEIQVAHAETLKRQPALYPFWRSDIRTFNVEKGSYNWTADNVFHGEIPKNIVMCFCSSESFSGKYNKNPYNFKNYNINYAEVMVNGLSTPSQPYMPNFETGDYTTAYLNLVEGTKGGLIERSDYSQGYAFFSFDLQNQVSDDLVCTIKGGHTRVNVKFAEPLNENVTVILYSKFPDMFQIDNVRNVL